MNRLIRKLRFTLAISALGADLASKFLLMREAIRIQVNSLRGRQGRPYAARIGSSQCFSKVHFRGTIDELYVLTDIFVRKSYQWDRQPVRVILDLGANTGIASVWFMLKFPEATIHAYEPDPAIFEWLQKNLHQFPTARTFNAAIADRGGVVDFYRSRQSTSSSLLPTPGSVMERVASTTLDQAIEDVGGRVDLAKIDIEGAEFDMLAASKRVGDIAAIVGEVHPAKGGKKVEDLVATLSRTHDVRAGGQGDQKSLFWAERKNP